jgi:histidine triad (HIT) family protein
LEQESEGVSESCIFCQIARKEAPASVVYEDERTIVFMDIRPVNEGHTLTIPKRHYVDIFDTPVEVLVEMHKITKKIAAAVKKTTNADGLSIVQQNGAAAGQDIFHIHVHIIPRFEGQKMPHFSNLATVNRQTLDGMAEKIRKSL